MATKINRRSVKLGGLSINYLVELLNVSRGKKGFNDLFEVSPIKFKRGFIKYLDWCVERGFIKKEKINHVHTEYNTTTYGKKLLRMLQ